MKHIARCLNNKLIGLCEKTLELEWLNTLMTKYLPEDLHVHCKVGSFNRGCLLLVIDDPIWSTKLRFLLPELRDQLRKEANLYKLVSIKIQVLMPIKETISPKSKYNISSNAYENIIKSAQQCSYEPLKKALYALGDHIKCTNGKH